MTISDEPTALATLSRVQRGELAGPEREAAIGLLRDYRTRQARQGLPAFPSSAGAAERARKWRDGVEAWALDGSVPENLGRLAGPVADEARRGALAAYLTGAHPHRALRDFTAVSQSLATAWGKPHLGADPAAWEAEAREKVRALRDERRAVAGGAPVAPAEGEGEPTAPTALVPRMVRAALSGSQDWLGEYYAWQDWARKQPGVSFQGDNLKKYEKIARGAYERTQQQVAELTPAVDRAMAEFAKEQAHRGSYGGGGLVAVMQDIPVEKRPMFLALLETRGKALGEAKEAGGQFWQAAGRGMATQLVFGPARAAEMGELVDAEKKLATMKPGDEFGGRFGDLEKYARGRSSDSMELRLLGVILEPLLKNKVATAESIAEAKAKVKEAQESVKLSHTLGEWAEGTADPIKGAGWWQEKVFYPAAESVLPSLAAVALSRGIGGGAAVFSGAGKLASLGNMAMAAPGAIPLLYGMQKDANAGELLRDYPHLSMDRVDSLASKGAAFQTGVEYASEVFTLGLGSKAGGLSRELAGLKKAAWKRLGVEAAKVGAAENAEEAVQDIAVPILTALEKDLPRDWEKWRAGYWTQRGDVFLSLLPTMVFGGAMRTMKDKIRAEGLEAAAAGLNDVTLHAAGVDEATRAAVLAVADPGARLDAAADAVAAGSAEVAAEGQARLESERAAAVAELESLDVQARSVGRDGEGWWLDTGEGKRLRVSGPRAALALERDLRQARSGSEANAWVQMADFFAGRDVEPSETRFSGELVETTATDGTVQRVKTRLATGAVTSEEVAGPEAETLRAELGQLAQDAGELRGVVFGENYVETTAEGAAKYVRVLHAGGSVLDLAEEDVEARWKRGMEKGSIDAAGSRSFLRAALPVLESLGSRLGHQVAQEEKEAGKGARFAASMRENLASRPELAESEAAATEMAGYEAEAKDLAATARGGRDALALLELVRRGAAEGSTTDDLREAVVKLAVADLLGRGKNGEQFMPGAFSAGLREAILGASSSQERAGLSKFERFFNAVKQWFRGIFKVGAALKAARLRGELGQDYEHMVGKLLGEEAGETLRVGRMEAEIDSWLHSQTPPEIREPGKSYALSPSSRVELVSRHLQDTLKSTDKGTTEFLKTARESLEKLRNRWLNAPEPKLKSQLDYEEKHWFQQRWDELRNAAEADVFERNPVFDTVAFPTKWSESDLAAYLKTNVPMFGGRRHSPRINIKPPSVYRKEHFNRWVRGEVDSPVPKAGEYDGADSIPEYLFDKTATASPDDVAKEIYENHPHLLRDDSPDALWDAIKQVLASSSENAERYKKAEQELRDARKAAKEQARREALDRRKEADAAQSALENPRLAAARDLATMDALLLALPPEVRGKLKFTRAEFASLTTDRRFKKVLADRVRAIGIALDDARKEEVERQWKALLKAAGHTEAGKKPKGKIGVYGHKYLAYAQQVSGLSGHSITGEMAALEAEHQEAEASNDFDAAAWANDKMQILGMWGGFAVGGQSLSQREAALEHGWKTVRDGRSAWLGQEEDRLASQRGMAKRVMQAVGLGDYGRLSTVAWDALPEQIRRVFLELRDFEGAMSGLLGRDHPLTQRWSRAVAEGYHRRDMAINHKKWDFERVLAGIWGGTRTSRSKELWKIVKDKSIQLSITERVPDPTVSSADTALQRQEGTEPETVTNVVSITQDQGIYLTMLWAQKGYQGALESSGWGEKEMQVVEAQLSPAARTLRAYLREQYDAEHKPLNELYERMFGISMPKIKNYAPGVFYNAGQERAMEIDGAGALSGGFRDGWAKMRKEHRARPKLASALQTYWSHTSQVEHWKALAEPVREIRGVFRNPNVKASVDAHWGPLGNAFLEKWFQILESDGLDMHAGVAEQLLQALTSRFAIGKLAGNMGTLIKQAPSAIYSAIDIGFGEYAAGVGEVMRNPSLYLDIWQSEVIQRRLEAGGMTPEMKATVNKFFQTKPNMVKTVMWRLFGLVGQADAVFSALSAVAAYHAHERRGSALGLQGQTLHRHALAEASRVVERTAQPISSERKSLMEHKAGALGKLMWMFASDPRNKAALVLEAWGRVFDRQATARDLRVLTVVHLFIGSLGWLATSAVRDMRTPDGDDGDDPAWEFSDWLISVALGPASGLPLIAEALSWSTDAIAGRRAFEPGGNNVVADPVVGSAQGVTGMIKELADDETEAEEVAKDAMRVMDAIGGAPASTARLIKDAVRVKEAFESEKDTQEKEKGTKVKP